jgi:hypothetical protein
LPTDLRFRLPQSHHDWSDAEKSELERLRSAWPPPNYELECGLTDDGDPWCVVRDLSRDVIVIHLARIERRYAILRSDREMSTTSTLLSRAIDLAIR